MKRYAIIIPLIVIAAGVWNAQRSSSPRHAAPAAARVSTITVDRDDTFDLTIGTEAVGDYLEAIARAEWLAGIERAASEEAARRQAALPRASSAPSRGSCNGDVDCFLACTRAHESDTAGGYTAVSPGGTYRGAYQFDASTWAGAVSRAGYEEYAGTPADQVPAEVQDAAATTLYGERGTQPWGGRC